MLSFKKGRYFMPAFLITVESYLANPVAFEIFFVQFLSKHLLYRPIFT